MDRMMEKTPRMGINDWLFYTYQQDNEGTVEGQELYNQYIEEVAGSTKPKTKIAISRIIKSMFPGVVIEQIYEHGQKAQVYKGISQKVHREDENEANFHFNNLCNLEAVKQLNFFQLPCSSPGTMKLGYYHPFQVNKVPVLTEINLEPTGMVNISTLGNQIDLESVCLGPKLQRTKSGVISYLTAVTKLLFCKGYSANFSSNNSTVLKEMFMSADSRSPVNVFRSVNCQRVVSPASKTHCCTKCSRQSWNFIQKQKVAKSTSKPVQVAADPSQMPPVPPTCSPSPEETVSQISSQLDTLFPGLGEKTDGLKILIECQVKNLHVNEKRRHRWDPRIIRLCLMLWGRSPRAYMDLRSSGFLLLPTVRLLQYYKNCIEQKPGIQRKMLEWMMAEAEKLNLPGIGREGGLLLDEMAIQEDLQIENRKGSCQLKGFSDLGETSEAMEVLKTGKREAKLATHVLQLVFLGDSGFRFPFAHFPTTEATSSDLFYIVWEAIGALRDFTFKVNYISMDGASTNRAFMKLHFSDSSIKGMRDQCFAVRNLMPPNDEVVFLMDPSHMFKKIRNNVLKSGNGAQHKRHLLVQGHSIHWKAWIDAYNWDRATNSLRIHHKLSVDHIFPDQTLKMRNHLAEEVLDSDMLYLMQSYQRSLGTAEAEKLTSVIHFLQKTTTLIEIFRDCRPVFKLDDPRLEKLKAVHEWFVNWENRVKLSLSQMPPGFRCEMDQRKKHMMTDQTREDLSSAILGFTKLCQIKINRKYPGSVIPGRVNTDIVENIFCQQRGIHHGNTTNPNYSSYSTGINAVVLGQSSTSKKRSSNCGLKAADPIPFSLNVSLRKLPKKTHHPRL